MANDKREAAWNNAVFGEADILAEITNAPDPRARNILYIKRGFYAGYAAATADGIPQADGWVDVKCSNCGKIVTVGNDADTPLPT